MSLRERQETQYPFLDYDFLPMYDELLKHDLIDFPETRWLHEASKFDDPNYCKYHRLVGHPIEKCFVFKDKMMEFTRDGKFELENATESMNQVSISSKKSALLLIEKNNGKESGNNISAHFLLMSSPMMRNLSIVLISMLSMLNNMCWCCNIAT